MEVIRDTIKLKTYFFLISDFDSLFKGKKPHQKNKEKIYILNAKARNFSDRK